MLKKINKLQLGVLLYVSAIIMFAFHSGNDMLWMVYREYSIMLAMIVIFSYAVKVDKTEMDTSLIIGILFQRFTSLVLLQLWYINGSDWWDTPLIFSTIVVVCLFLGIIIKKLWK